MEPIFLDDSNKKNVLKDRNSFEMGSYGNYIISQIIYRFEIYLCLAYDYLCSPLKCYHYIHTFHSCFSYLWHMMQLNNKQLESNMP